MGSTVKEVNASKSIQGSLQKLNMNKDIVYSMQTHQEAHFGLFSKIITSIQTIMISGGAVRG